MVLKAPRKSQPRMTIVIRGNHIQYVEGLSGSDYAVVIPDSIVHSDSQVHGRAFDSRGGVSNFKMPLDTFTNLEFLEFESSKDSTRQRVA